MKRLLSILVVLTWLTDCKSQCNTSYIVFQGKPSWASSQENASYPSSNAFDGNRMTRRSSAYRDNEFLAVDLGEVLELCQVNLYWENAFGRDFNIELSNDSVSWTIVASISGNVDFRNSISIAGYGRYVRMHGLARGTGNGFSLFGMHVFGKAVAFSCPPTNLALGMPAASSTEASGFPDSSAFDGSSSTRWSSQFSDTQSIYVDLAGNYALCKVTLQWEAAYGTDFTIDGSSDAVSWTTLASVVGNTSLTNIIPVSANARYVRFSGTRRATSFGYSLYEFTVQGGIVLPLQFESLSANLNKKNTVELSWISQGDDPWHRFQIERSSNGVNFESQFLGNFPRSSTNEYVWMDVNPLPGKNYYRIKEIAVDGGITFSKTIMVQFRPEVHSILLFPNPAHDKIVIQGSM